jgi:hypothetical protein
MSHIERAGGGAMRSILEWPVLTIVLSLTALPAATHHSFTPLLTETGGEAIEVFEGSIELYKLINPHAALIVNVVNQQGIAEDWLIELSSSSRLTREGWTEDSLSAGDRITIAILKSRTPNRGRLRAILVHGAAPEDDARLLVAYGIRGDTPIMRRLRERLPTCGSIEPRFEGTECFWIDNRAMRALEEEFPGKMGYVMP